MSNYYQTGDIILVRFPFTDLSSSKVRPSLVISAWGDDLIVVGIFSRVPDTIKNTWVMLKEGSPNFASTGLKKTSVIKTEKIAVIHRSVVRQKLGSLPQKFMIQVNEALKKALRIE
mgnify:CR=1 FL=1